MARPINHGRVARRHGRAMTNVCLVCGSPFRPLNSQQLCCGPKCSAVRIKAVAQARYLATRQLVRLPCRRCGKPLEARGPRSGNWRYCAEPCTVPTAEPVDGGIPCQNCGRLFKQGKASQRFCATPCRLSWNKAKNAGPADDSDEEILDLEAAPRRSDSPCFSISTRETDSSTMAQRVRLGGASGASSF